jgi:phenylpropionate dioxygenase-like ring-hydroxylating dioxygenase large terminal subunit
LTQTQPTREDRIRRALTHLRNNTTDEFDHVTSLAPTDYTDPEIATRERNLIFGRVPSIVAHSTELPDPNDFITLALPRNNAIIVRQENGQVRAFVNACRHRGALLEEQPSGNCRLFSCGYHRWSYNPDGTLRTVTLEHTFGDIDHAQYGLVELPAEERHGFIWVVDSAQASIDVADWLGEMDAILHEYALQDLVCIESEGFDEPVNWKIMQDGFLDGYHIKYAHPNTAARHIHTNISAFEDLAPHSRWIKPRKTMDRYIDDDPGDSPLDQHVIETHHLMPNSTLLRHPDHFQLLTFRPHRKDPGRSVMEMRLIVPTPDAAGMAEDAWRKRWEKNWDILLMVLHEEDFPLLRNAQVALGSADAGDMILGRNEIANQVFRRETQRLLCPLTGPEGCERQ